MEDNSIFRKSSIERLSSPEQIDEYVKVISPPMRMAVIAFVLLIAGLLVWALFYEIDTVITCDGFVTDGVLTVSVPASEVKKLDDDTVMIVNNERTTLTSVVKRNGRYIIHADVQGVENGLQDVHIIIESITPIELILS